MITLSTPARTARSQALNALIGPSASITILDASGNVLVTCVGNATSFGTSVNGILTALPITSAVATGTGTAVQAVIANAVTMDVGTSGASMTISQTNITTGSAVAITSIVLTEP